jgi:hypothetical protein
VCKCVTYHAPAHGVNIPHSTHTNTHTHTRTHTYIYMCVCERERERERERECVCLCVTHCNSLVSCRFCHSGSISQGTGRLYLLLLLIPGPFLSLNVRL